MAIKSGVRSGVSSFSYPKEGETLPPTANKESGTTFESGITIQLSSGTPGATIYYTKDGSEPTTDSLVYDPSYGIVLTQTTTIRTFATSEGLADSVAASLTYELVGSSCPDLSAGNFGWVDFNAGSSSNAQLKDWLANPGTAPTTWYTRVCTSDTDVNCRDAHDPTDQSDDHWRLTGARSTERLLVIPSVELNCILPGARDGGAQHRVEMIGRKRQIVECARLGVSGIRHSLANIGWVAEIRCHRAPERRDMPLAGEKARISVGNNAGDGADIGDHGRKSCRLCF